MTEYIQTQEKIEKLSSLDSLIDKLNDLLEQKPGQKHYDDPVEFWIAGGAVLSAITDAPTKDYDTYCSNYELMIERLKGRGVDCNQYEHGLFSHLQIDNKLIEITSRTFQTSSEILDKYDFTIISAAYDGKILTHHPRFWQDVAIKTIELTGVNFPVRTLMRVIKYTSRGYTPTTKTMSELIRMLSSRE